MLQTVLRSDDLPPEERSARFDAAAGSHLITGRDRDPEGVRFRLRTADLGGVHVADLRYTNVQSRGGTWSVQPYGPGLCGVFLLSGALPVAQEGRMAELSGGGEFTVYDSAEPVEVPYPESKDPYVNTFDHIRVFVPGELVSLPTSGFRRLAGARLPGQNGMGRLLTQFIASLAAEDPAASTAADRARVGAVTTDLFAAALAHFLDAAVPLPDESCRAAHLQRLRAYIQRHLGDPDLSPRTIAAAHHISVSYLYRLFGDNGSTVAAWVRRQRLERARRDLADPAMEGVPVYRIAARWGYTDHATFTRSFRTAYGISPQAYRASVLN
jgi:AraC-like DNA-binding protein